MIRPLRRRHWRWMVALAVLLPLVFLLLLGARNASLFDSAAPLKIDTTSSLERP